MKDNINILLDSKRRQLEGDNSDDIDSALQTLSKLKEKFAIKGKNESC